jgi:hypothetical protein
MLEQKERRMVSMKIERRRRRSWWWWRWWRRRMLTWMLKQKE